MWIISSYSFALSFFFIFIATSNNKNCATDTLSLDIINQTCKICAEESSVLSYNFCSSSLESIPISHATNLEGLAIISMELALRNATNTISTIKGLLSRGTFTPLAFACLEDCLELYSDAVMTLVDGVAAFLTGHYAVANVKISAVMEASATCEEGFTEREGEVSPLTRENYNLFQLCDIGLCIINLLSLAVSSS